jgi:hypothetical protein
MSRKLYVLSFMGMAITFVPVLFFFGFGEQVAPCCYAFFEILTGRGDKAGLSLLLVYVVIYSGLFYALARGTFWASMLLSKKSNQTAIQTLCLLALFSCSFIRAIQESGGRDFGSGTYNFWGACARYLETYQKYEFQPH